MIEFLSANWFWVFVAAFVFFAVGMGLHLRNMLKPSHEFDGRAAFGRLAFAFIFWLLGSFCVILGLIGVVFSAMKNYQ